MRALVRLCAQSLYPFGYCLIDVLGNTSHLTVFLCFNLSKCSVEVSLRFNEKDFDVFEIRSEKVTVAYTFLFQSDVSARSGFRTIQERTEGSECSMKAPADGKILLRITRKVTNTPEAITLVKGELVTDLGKYGGEFQHWRYHLVVSENSISNKSISLGATLLAWLTPPGDARNYVTRRMPFFSVIFALILGLAIAAWAL